MAFEKFAPLVFAGVVAASGGRGFCTTATLEAAFGAAFSATFGVGMDAFCGAAEGFGFTVGIRRGSRVFEPLVLGVLGFC